MARPINIAVFPGMDNVALKGFTARTPDGRPEKVALPIIHNMSVTTDMKLEKRQGYSLWVALPGAHSLWFDGQDFFCAAANASTPEALYRVTADKAVLKICDITGLGEPLSYVKVNDNVYISSRMWNGVYANGLIREWGVDYSDDPADFEAATSSEEYMLLGDIKAPRMENLVLAGGRILGSVGANVYYNDPPLAYEMFRPDTFHPFTEPISMIAVANEGIYFASENRTWFAAGYAPSEWKFDVVGDGAIAGSSQVIPSLKQHSNVPVWLNKRGVQAGIGGSVQPLTQDTVRFSAAGRAASVFKKQGGGQYLANFVQPTDVGFGDAATCEVVRNGKLIT